MERPARRWTSRAGARGLAVALLVAVSAGCGAVAQAAASPAPSALARGAARSAAANQKDAQRDAASLLAQLNLPAVATRQAGEPAGDDGTLGEPSSGPAATPNTVDDHAWWVVPETPAHVLQYVDSHPPAGGSATMAGEAIGPGRPAVNTTGFAWRAIPGRLSVRWLIVAVVRLKDGSTGVRADSEVVWITPRPRSERIPATARRVVVTNHRGDTLVQGPITVTSPATVAKLVSLINRLPAWQPGVYSCPADFGWHIRLAFYANQHPGSSPIAAATIDPNGCGLVRLTLAGKAQPALADGYDATKRLSALLHVKFDSGIP